MNLQNMSVLDILRVSDRVIDELLRRGIVKTRNKPIGGYTEWLVCRGLGLKPAKNNQRGYDATDDLEVRYQIKGRQVNPKTADKDAPVSGEIKGLGSGVFNVLVVVIFDKDWRVQNAIKAPYHVVMENKRGKKRHHILLSPGFMALPGVKDLRCGLLATQGTAGVPPTEGGP